VQVERIDGAETPADLATATSATATKSALGDAATHPTRASAAADEDEDGASSSVLAMATSLFNEFGNGSLDAFEFQTVASRFGKILTTKEAAEVMKSMDTDRNVKKLLPALTFKKYCQLFF
jgi:hypothetical protein